MLSSVSDNLKSSLNRGTPVYKKTVTLYRKVWDTNHYDFATGVDITSQVVDAGKVMWKLDKEGFNVWSVGNSTLTLRNDRQQWKQDNPKGYFPSGYLLHGSKVRISVGAQLSDGTFETPYIFTGLIVTDPICDLEEKTAVITLEGLMATFDKFNAEDICQTVTDEAHAYSTPGQTVFTTAQNGVASVGLVVKRGTTASGAGSASVIYPTTGYTISGQNTKGAPLTITLTSALTATESVWFSYRYWYTDKPLEWIVEEIMALCGITSYAISTAVFSNSIENTWVQTTQADWQAGTASDVDTVAFPDSVTLGYLRVLDDWTDADYASNPAWTVNSGTFKAYSNYYGTGGALVCQTTGSIYTASAGYNTGTWEFRLNGTHPNLVGRADFHFISDGTNPANNNGYFFRFYQTAYPTKIASIYLYRNDNGVATQLASYSWSAGGPATIPTIRITRTAAGVFNVYVDGTLYWTVTDNTHDTANYYIFDGYMASAYGYSYINAIYHSAFIIPTGRYIASGNIITQAKNTTGTPTAWGIVSVIGDVPAGASATYETSVSADGATWDAWVACGSGGEILSDKKQYIRARINLSTTDTTVSAQIDQITVYWYTSTTVVDLVDLTGLTCADVLELCAKLPCYEIGFDSTDKFIYRPRTSGSLPVINLTSGDNVIRLQTITDGVDRVYNRVTAQFGIYTSISDASADSEPNSITKYGTRAYSIASSSLLPAANVNMAYSVAPTIATYTKNPRRQCQAVCRCLPYLELGDKVTLYFKEPTALRQWHWGDTDVSYGDIALEYHTEAIVAQRLAFWGTEMRIEGIEFDWWASSPESGWNMTLDLVEVV